MKDLTIDGFAEHAERMAQDSNRDNHAVPCPCPECVAEAHCYECGRDYCVCCPECELPPWSKAHLEHCPEAIRG